MLGFRSLRQSGACSADFGRVPSLPLTQRLVTSISAPTLGRSKRLELLVKRVMSESWGLGSRRPVGSCRQGPPIPTTSFFLPSTHAHSPLVSCRCQWAAASPRQQSQRRILRAGAMPETSKPELGTLLTFLWCFFSAKNSLIPIATWRSKEWFEETDAEVLLTTVEEVRGQALTRPEA